MVSGFRPHFEDLVFNRFFFQLFIFFYVRSINTSSFHSRMFNYGERGGGVVCECRWVWHFCTSVITGTKEAFRHRGATEIPPSVPIKWRRKKNPNGTLFFNGKQFHFFIFTIICVKTKKTRQYRKDARRHDRVTACDEAAFRASLIGGKEHAALYLCEN